MNIKSKIVTAAVATFAAFTGAFAQDNLAEVATPTEVVEAPVEAAAPEAVSPKVSFFAKSFNLGLRAGIGYSTLWDTPNENFEDYDGGLMALGVSANFNLNPHLSIYTGVDFSFTFIEKTLETFETEVCTKGFFSGCEDRDVDIIQELMLINFDVPVLLRVRPVPSFFIEAGAKVSFNIGNSEDVTLKDSETGDEFDNVDEIKISTWNLNTVNAAAVFGLGGTIKIGKRLMDIGARFDMNFTPLEDNKLIDNTSSLLAVQVYVNYWLF